MKVFAVSEQVVIPETFLASEIEQKSKISIDFKSRLSSLNNLFSKIKNITDEKEPIKEVIEEPIEKNESENNELKNCLNESLPEIVLNPHDQVLDQEVFDKIQDIPDDDKVENEALETVDILSVVKSLTNPNVQAKKIQLSKSEVKGFEVLRENSNRFQEQKALQSVQEVVQSSAKLGHAFKCMAYFCSYTTDTASDFIAHLNEVHSVQVQKSF